MIKPVRQVSTRKIPSYQLTGSPEIPVLTDYLHNVMEHQSEILELRWTSDQDDGFYSLVLRAPSDSGDARWSFYFASSLLWEYTSCDVLLIHNMISMTSNKQERVIQGDGLLATSKTYRRITGQSDVYFIRTIGIPDVKPALDPAVAQPGEPAKIVLPKAAGITPKPIDATAIESIMLKLRDSQTGLYTYPAFLYFLEQAYFQSCRTHVPVSVILIELSVKNLLTKEETFQIVTHLTAAKRRTDMLAQYDSGDIAVLAPSTNDSGVRTFSNRLVKALETALAHQPNKEIDFAVGTATYPQEGESMGVLLAAAEAAKNYAKSTGFRMSAFADIRQDV